MNGGKWDGMMKQTHIGYTGWQQPATGDAAGEADSDTGCAEADCLRSHDPRLRPRAAAIAIEAPHYSRAVAGKDLAWLRIIPHLGRTLGAVTALPQGRRSDDAAGWRASRI